MCYFRAYKAASLAEREVQHRADKQKPEVINSATNIQYFLRIFCDIRLHICK